MEDFQPAQRYTVRDLETLKVISDPLRSHIFEALTHQPLTVRQLADRLGLAPSKLYYHVNTLEKHNLIRVVETRMVANMIEKYYRVTALNLDVDPALFSFSVDAQQDSLVSVFTSFTETIRDDLMRIVQARRETLEQGEQGVASTVMLVRQLSRIPESRAAAFHTRLKELLEEFEAADSGDADSGPDARPFALNIAMYPNLYYQDTPPTDDRAD